MTRRAVWLLVGWFVVLGLPDAAHGVAWPAMRGELHRPLADLGWALAAMSAAYLVAAGATGAVERRLGLGRLIALSGAAAGVGLVGIAVAPGWAWVVAAFTVHGAGSGGLDGSINAYVAIHGRASTMGLIHAGYGIGAAIGPVTVRAAAVLGAGWRGAYAVLAGAHLAVLLLGSAAGEAAAGPVERPEPTTESRGGRWAGPFAFATYVAFEAAAGVWAYVAVTGDGIGATPAALAVAAYWGGMTAGRLALGVVGDRGGIGGRPRGLLAWCAAGAVAGTALLAGGGWWTVVGLPLTGLALAPMFPVLMQITPERVGHSRAVSAVGWQAAAGAFGGIVGSAATGVALERAGTDAYRPAVVLWCVAMLAGLAAVTARPRSLKTFSR